MRRAEEILEIAETLREMAEDAGDEKHRCLWRRCSVPTPPSSRHWSMPTSRLLSRNRAKRARPAPSPWGENPEAEPSPSLSADALRVAGRYSCDDEDEDEVSGLVDRGSLALAGHRYASGRS